MRKVLIVLGLLAASLTPSALADPATIRIPVTQADVQDEASLARLYGRVEAAAETLCGPRQSEPLELLRARSTCRTRTVEAAIRDADIAPLSQFHAAIVESGRAGPARSVSVAAR